MAGLKRNVFACIVTLACLVGLGGINVARASLNTASPATWEAIASFYAGKPVSFDWDSKRTAGGATYGDGRISLAAPFRERLDALASALRSGKKADIQRQSVLGVDPLAVLLHEAMHNRDDLLEGFGRSKRDEKQAAALGAELVPDLLQRFFGIPINSPLSRMFEKSAKGRGEYQGAYR